MAAAPEDSVSLADAIVAAATDPVAAARMAKLAREQAEKRFSIDAVAARYTDLYSELARPASEARTW